MEEQRKQEGGGKLGLIEQGTQHHFARVPVLRVLFIEILASQVRQPC
jgi:hypothetical protein